MKYAIGKAALAAAVFLAYSLFLSALLGFAAAALLAMQGPEAVTPEAILTLLTTDPLMKTASFALTACGAAGTAALLYYALERGEKSWALGWKQRAWLPKAALGLLLGALLMTLNFVLVHALGGVRIAGAAWTREIAVLLAMDAFMFATVAVGEETLSRGYVYGAAKRHAGTGAAVVVSSALFALLHANNAAVFSGVFPLLNLTLAGVMLALLREWSGGLWVPIGVHMTWNFFQGDVFGMAVSGVTTPSILQIETVNDFIAGGAFGLEGSFVTTIVTAGVSAWLIAALRNRSSRT